MLELLPETEGTLVAMRGAGVVTKADETAMIPRLEDILEEQGGRFRIFMDATDVTELEKGVKSDTLWFDMRYWPRVERVALVGGKVWADEITRMTDIYKAAKVRRFEAGERAAALGWLRGD